MASPVCDKQHYFVQIRLFYSRNLQLNIAEIYMRPSLELGKRNKGTKNNSNALAFVTRCLIV